MKTIMPAILFLLMMGGCGGDGGGEGDASEDGTMDPALDTETHADPPVDSPIDRPGDPPVEEELCPAGTTPCGTQCVDIASDPENCGECGNACGEHEACEAGDCVLQVELFYGELHGHTENSDGTGTITQYLTFCRDDSLMDFCAVTDHNPSQAVVEAYLTAAASFTAPTFLVLAGTEWSSGTIGHKVCYGITTACQAWADECDTPAKLYASASADGGLCHAAHPSMTWTGQGPTDWSYSDDAVERAGEIYSDEAKMHEAWLDFGLRIGVVGVSDTHGGRPGASGVTGCYAFELSREGILEALTARRCFATGSPVNRADNPVALEFKLNGRWMGEAIPVPEGETLAFTVSAASAAQIEMITIKKDGEVLATKEDCPADACEWAREATSEGPAYYTVVVDVLGNTLWSPPIFVE